MGYVFSLSQLVKFHHARKYRENLGEAEIKKFLINPYTNMPFPSYTVEHIKAAAQLRSMTINPLTPHMKHDNEHTSPISPQLNFNNPSMIRRLDLDALSMHLSLMHLTQRSNYSSHQPLFIQPQPDSPPAANDSRLVMSPTL